MHIYRKIYQFAASAGALEGYVYRKTRAELDLEALEKWTDNLRRGYDHLPAAARAEFQADLDRTLGRALHSLTAALGKEHELAARLQALIAGVGDRPASADDFNKQKWFARP